jgi:hypothetical protein
MVVVGLEMVSRGWQCVVPVISGNKFDQILVAALILPVETGRPPRAWFKDFAFSGIHSIKPGQPHGSYVMLIAIIFTFHIARTQEVTDCQSVVCH